jgi:hypothetical protein
MPRWTRLPWQRDSNQTASGKPGAVHIALEITPLTLGRDKVIEARLPTSNTCYSSSSIEASPAFPAGRSLLNERCNSLYAIFGEIGIHALVEAKRGGNR